MLPHHHQAILNTSACTDNWCQVSYRNTTRHWIPQHLYILSAQSSLKLAVRPAYAHQHRYLAVFATYVIRTEFSSKREVSLSLIWLLSINITQDLESSKHRPVRYTKPDETQFTLRQLIIIITRYVWGSSSLSLRVMCEAAHHQYGLCVRQFIIIITGYVWGSWAEAALVCAPAVSSLPRARARNMSSCCGPEIYWLIYEAPYCLLCREREYHVHGVLYLSHTGYLEWN